MLWRVTKSDWFRFLRIFWSFRVLISEQISIFSEYGKFWNLRWGGGGYPLTFGLGASPFLYMSIHKCTNAESPFSSGPTDPSGHRISLDQLKAPNATPKFTQGILLSTQRIWEAFSLSTRLDCSLIQIIGMPTNANFVFRTRITKFEKPVIDYAEIVFQSRWRNHL
jgi:hypothetical protein